MGVLNLVGACGSLASTATIWKSLGPAGRKGQIGEAYFPTVFFHVFSITYNEYVIRLLKAWMGLFFIFLREDVC